MYVCIGLGVGKAVWGMECSFGTLQNSLFHFHLLITEARSQNSQNFALMSIKIVTTYINPCKIQTKNNK